MFLLVGYFFVYCDYVNELFLGEGLFNPKLLSSRKSLVLDLKKFYSYFAYFIDPIDLVEFCLLKLAGLDLGFYYFFKAVGMYPMSSSRISSSSKLIIRINTSEIHVISIFS